jgi:hypothetical protein
MYLKVEYSTDILIIEPPLQQLLSKLTAKKPRVSTPYP